MNLVLRLLSFLYGLLLRAYQAQFRSQFGEEMQQVFNEALGEAARQDWRKVLPVFWRELHDLPAILARESQDWAGASAGKSAQEISGSLLADQPPGSWCSALLAGAPHLLYALGLHLSTAAALDTAQPLIRLSGGLVFWLLVFIALLLARKHGWPRWSHSWIGYGMVFVLHQLNAFFSSWPLALIILFAWLTLMVISLLWLARGDWLGGLLAALPITPMWIWQVSMQGIGSNMGKNILYLSIGLLVALAVIAIVRVGRWQTAVWLILAVILAAGLPISYGTAFFSPYRTEPHGWSLIVGVLGNYAAMLAFTAPLWLLALWRQVRQRRTPI